MQFTTTLIASILAVAVTAAPGSAAAGDLEKRQVVDCGAGNCPNLVQESLCVIRNLAFLNVNGAINCVTGGQSTICNCASCVPAVEAFLAAFPGIINCPA
ncbi:hypothetical protein BFW01_g12812 [Lasiodiplodia theobromae]|uniref:uncharacterized protein n=1 Tax=Lasiodiplodia theobromae TaxID=45133 RepID=UPI0015C32945|nr:uncharacterized protein LTHEOB_8539 [Lasiodiplodia theobromae]KAF4541544.1 hypothetical protein LTHEOB_8539 [Lasiodiplodia theobromae]KAF9641006.1 hypothetical protein BFW01_g12812 [Lasiodiplodia theobromae]